VSSGLEGWNTLPSEEAEARLLSCCGSREWARRVAAGRPYRGAGDLAAAADRVWRSLSRNDWLEAFAAHPKIGASAAKGDAKSRRWSRAEQAGTASASPETLANLADANRDYEERFGHIFIVCATGKNAGEMLALLEARLHNDPQTELATAAEEQRKILQLRLTKLLESEET
jgi:OHCU decarboxylase